MAKKKKAGALTKSFQGLDRGLKGLGVLEKDLDKVRKNLRKFLDRADKLLSGPSTKQSKVPRGKRSRTRIRHK